MSILDCIADCLDRRILKRHDRRKSTDEPWQLVCKVHPEPVLWPCDDWFRAVARIKARRHSGEDS